MSGTTCPICDVTMPADWSEYPEYPFCTRRCKTIDLGRWLSEEYTLGSPGERSEDASTTPTAEEKET